MDINLSRNGGAKIPGGYTSRITLRVGEGIWMKIEIRIVVSISEYCAVSYRRLTTIANGSKCSVLVKRS